MTSIQEKQKTIQQKRKKSLAVKRTVILEHEHFNQYL